MTGKLFPFPIRCANCNREIRSAISNCCPVCGHSLPTTIAASAASVTVELRHDGNVE